MNRRGFAVIFSGLLTLSMSLFHQDASAEVRYFLKSPQGEDVQVSTVNQKREGNSLVIYTPEYGPSTRTNPYGVEVSAEKVPNAKNRYRVKQVRSVFECQKEETLANCGNLAIPADGVVLSATDSKRNTLLEQFKPGAEFELTPALTYTSTAKLNVTNPNPQNNPVGAGFPGFRGGNQLIMYTGAFGQPTTGTNEFGFEVTVKDGRVVEHGGANSLIPKEPFDYVLSGHGKAREWLLQNAPIGSKVEMQGDQIVSHIDRDTYLYQLDTMVSKIQNLPKGKIPYELDYRLDILKLRNLQMTDQDIAQEAVDLQNALRPYLWAAYPPVASTAPRAIWHRPSESSTKEIAHSLDMLKKGGFNTINLETYLHGDPIFPSQTFKKYNIAQKLPFQLTDSKGDLLKIWLDEAHKRGMKVHVWFQTFYAGNTQYDKTKGSILNAHPEWANIQRSALNQASLPPSTLEPGAFFLDPANPEAQQFVLDLIDEIITRYPVDGFQLDYIRYPSSFPPNKIAYVATSWGYSPAARQAFKAKTGFDPAEITPTEHPQLWEEWARFKTAQVDAFVEKAHGLIKSRRPQMPISAAIFPSPAEALERKHQDWLGWTKKGWVDFLAPMTLTSSTEAIAMDTERLKEMTALPVVTGIFGPFNGNNPSEVVEQVYSAMTSGATGVTLFDTAHLTQKMAEALRSGIFSTNPQP